jgi:ferredoxin
MITPLALHDIFDSGAAMYAMRVYIQDGCGVKPVSVSWCGECIRQCWTAHYEPDLARYSPFGDNTQIIARVDGGNCARCAALKAFKAVR